MVKCEACQTQDLNGFRCFERDLIRPLRFRKGNWSVWKCAMLVSPPAVCQGFSGRWCMTCGSGAHDVIVTAQVRDVGLQDRYDSDSRFLGTAGWRYWISSDKFLTHIPPFLTKGHMNSQPWVSFFFGISCSGYWVTNRTVSHILLYIY